MNACDVAFTTLGGFEPGKAADGDELRSHAAFLQFAKEVVEADAVAADHDEIRELQLATEQLHGDDSACRHDLFVAIDRRKPIGAAEGRDAPRALAHGIRHVGAAFPGHRSPISEGGRRPGCAWSLNQSY